MALVEVLNAIVFDHESWDAETGTIDPAIRLQGELPATAKPFVVDRIYRGPQGSYDESFAIVAPDGEVTYQHPYARVNVRGEMYEDRFRDVVRDDVVFDSADEHELVLLIGNVPVARIPVFVDAPESPRAQGVVGDVIEATLKKSSIIWVTIPQPGGDTVTRPAWFVHEDGKVFVLTGPGEQDLTNIDAAEEVTITVRTSVTEMRAPVAEVPAEVRVVPNDSEEFDRIAKQGVNTRLNAADGQDAAQRWKSTCTMVELTPRT